MLTTLFPPRFNSLGRCLSKILYASFPVFPRLILVSRLIESIQDDQRVRKGRDDDWRGREMKVPINTRGKKELSLIYLKAWFVCPE